MSSFTAHCDVERRCRIAELAAKLIQTGTESMRMSHSFGGLALDEMRPAISAILDSRLVDRIDDARRRPGFTATEEFHVRVSEGQVAKRRAMAVLFPDDEE